MVWHWDYDYIHMTNQVHVYMYILILCLFHWKLIIHFFLDFIGSSYCFKTGNRKLFYTLDVFLSKELPNMG